MTFDFYGGPFSNFWDSVLIMADPWGETKIYPTVEHRFQAMKATTPHDHELVRKQPSAGQAKTAGRWILLRPDWDEVRYDVMVEALRVKFAYRNYRRKLLDTGTKEIREDSPTDFDWGFRSADGKDAGLNLLGKALMQVRGEIRQSLGRNA